MEISAYPGCHCANDLRLIIESHDIWLISDRLRQTHDRRTAMNYAHQ
jgi:hypothetical protein